MRMINELLKDASDGQAFVKALEDAELGNRRFVPMNVRVDGENRAARRARERQERREAGRKAVKR